MITGEAGKLIADSIPMENREYGTFGVSASLSASFEGNLTGGVGHYTSFNWETGMVEEYDTLEGGLNFSNPDIGASIGFSWLAFADSSKDVKGRSKIYGGDVDPIWFYNILNGNPESGPFSVGIEGIYSAEGKFLGIKLYASKSKSPIGIHGGITYGTKIINKKTMTMEEYRKKNHIGSDRTVWKYE